MRYGFATPFASSQEKLDFDFYRAIKEAGFDFIELPGTLINNISDEDFEKLSAFLKEIQLPSSGICSLFPGRIKFFDISGEDLEEYIDWIFAQAKKLGAQKIGFGSGGCRRLPDGMSSDEGMEIFVKKVREHIVPYLEKYDFQMVIEAFNPAEANFILTAAEAVQAAKLIGSERISILTDTLHMIGSAEVAAEVIPAVKDYIGHIHISEPERAMPVLEYSPACKAFVEEFVKMGYDGTICFESKCEKFEDLAPALQTLKKMMEGCGGR